METLEVKRRIESDVAEAMKFNYDGTPTFLVNGVTLEGAQSISAFEDILRRRGIDL